MKGERKGKRREKERDKKNNGERERERQQKRKKSGIEEKRRGRVTVVGRFDNLLSATISCLGSH